MDMYWRDRAACSGMDVDEFSYQVPLLSYRPPSKKQLKIFYAASLTCEKCPVREECKSSATPEDLQYTVRGGEIPPHREHPMADREKQEESLENRISIMLSNGKCGRRGHPILSRDDIDIQWSARGYSSPSCKQCRMDRNKRYQREARANAKMRA